MVVSLSHQKKLDYDQYPKIHLAKNRF